jgi:hypothetical protein
LVVAILLSLVLIAIGVLHLHWAGGGLWPGRDSDSLLRIVWGVEGAKGGVPAGPSAVVGAALCVAGLLPILHEGLVGPPVPDGALGKRMLPTAMTLAAFTFTIRGLAGYVPAWRRITNGEPFATLDVRLYLPRCLAIGAGFGILLL